MIAGSRRLLSASQRAGNTVVAVVLGWRGKINSN